jgi:NAD(P)-dependent dehydrogenase (short-subunit alcohol dehydrogenase family)
VFDLSGKVAVITGAGSGIGRAIAQVFGGRGALVEVLDVDEKAGEETAAGIREKGGDARATRVDVGAAADVETAFLAMEARRGRLDILVNNAGIAHVGDIEHTGEDDLDRLYRVNVKGVFLCSRAAIPAMMRGGGGVVLNMDSIAALVGVPERLAYSTTKGAVLSMTRSIAVDYMKKKIRCNCICPARVHTPFVDGYVRKNYPGRETEIYRQLSEYQPLGRMGNPEEVAALALYLCSDEASFITGQAYPIDGGVLVT